MSPENTLDGIPDESRAALPGYQWLREYIVTPANEDKIRLVLEVAEDLGCTPAQLAIAWCAKNPRVSTVMAQAGSSRCTKTWARSKSFRD